MPTGNNVHILACSVSFYFLGERLPSLPPGSYATVKKVKNGFVCVNSNPSRPRIHREQCQGNAL